MSYKTSRFIAEQRAHERLLFYPYNMSSATNQFVCWIDVMGSQEIMLRSLYVASNFLTKLHIAALRVAKEFSIELYPVIDGLYACSPSQRQILSFINRVHSMLAVTFILEDNQRFKFQVRSGLAYGAVVMGKQVLKCAKELQSNPLHTKSILLGSALTHAYQVEREAPPFGVVQHESAVVIAEEGSLSEKQLKWWQLFGRPNDLLLACELYYSLKEHYAWCSRNSFSLSYAKKDIYRHEALVDEYFAEIWSGQG
jgi:hypothetical protein